MTSLFAVIVSFLWLSSCLVADGAIRVAVNVEENSEINFGEKRKSRKKASVLSYSVINERNETLFKGGDLAVFMGGRWCVVPSPDFIGNPSNYNSASRLLVFSNQEHVNGTTPGLGYYKGVRIRWSCNLGESENDPEDDSQSVPIVTSFLNFDSQQAIVFDIEYPDGAENTSLVAYNQSDGDSATMATFPSFLMKTSSALVATQESGDKSDKRILSATKPSSLFPPTFPSALSWKGSFVQSVRGLSTGPRGGPTVFYNASDLALSSVVVASPFFGFLGRTNCNASHPCHHFNEFTAGNNKDWSGKFSAFSPGQSGRLTRIPAGSSQSILLYEGSRSGITSTIQEWGSIMQTSATQSMVSRATSKVNDALALILPHSSESTTGYKLPKVEDLTLERIGYQTDNGAMYCFCRDTNCSEVLLEEKNYLDSIGIPIGYLSFQGAGTSSGRGKAAPWCVETWSADGGQDPNNYPLDIGDFQKSLGLPLQLYAPYFCPNSTRYFQPDTPWKSVASNPDLPSCSGFAFETVRASDSKAFFEWFMSKGIQHAGMFSFESDFMDQNINCVDDFVENPVHGADAFLDGMASAALGLNVPIQWCYASPNVVMASLNFPAVTNFRVSFDYCYGESYAIGESSLLVWAMGAAPSKDTLWTTTNNHTETPGCDWTVDHEEVAAELHVVLALMSTGPVGISDAIGMTNATLLERIISKDGSLLQPSKPITAVDSSFLSENSGNKPDGYLYETHGLGISWIFVSFQLRHPFPVGFGDFWPPLPEAELIHLVYRSFASSSECLDGEDALSSGCVTLVNLEEVRNGTEDLLSVFVAPSSSFDFPGSDLSPSVITVWKKCPGGNGIFFLGELEKYVALSPKRFRSVECSDTGVLATIKGTIGEVVSITLLVPHVVDDGYTVVKENITVWNPEGLARFEYGTTNDWNEIAADAR